MMVAVFAVACLSHMATAKAGKMGTKAKGLMTNYGGPYDGVGAGQGSFGILNGGCGFGDLNSDSTYPYKHAIAFDPASPIIAGLPSFGCGSCWKITNNANSKSIIATVTDVCPGCAAKFGNPNHIDMFYGAWMKIAASSQVSSNGGGILDISIERAPCEPGDDAAVQIMDHQGTFSWLRVVPRQLAYFGTVTAVSVHCPDTITFGGNPEKDEKKKGMLLENTFGCVYELEKVPLYRKGSTCTITIMDEAGASITSSPIPLEKYVGHSVNEFVGLGANFGASGVTGRKLLSGGSSWNSTVFQGLATVRHQE